MHLNAVRVSGVQGRFEPLDMQGRPYSVVIDYAHTPDGLENILKAVKNYHKGRIITVFGCGRQPGFGKAAHNGRNSRPLQ